MKQILNIKSPWWWVPTLYFAEGIPYFIVNNISVIMFTKLGVPNEVMSLYTSLLYLPWVIKPFWSPFVDLIKTKRWWIILMQLLMSLSFIALVLSMPHPSSAMIAEKTTPVGLFKPMIILFYITAVASATHDIAADGFYMLALKEERQAFFVGIRSTFYRLSSIFGKGVLVMIAGRLETTGGDIPRAWSVTMIITALLFTAITFYHIFVIPKSAADRQREDRGVKIIIKEFADAFLSFFQKPRIAVAIAFLLLYRFPEAIMLKLADPFFFRQPGKRRPWIFNRPSRLYKWNGRRSFFAFRRHNRGNRGFKARSEKSALAYGPFSDPSLLRICLYEHYAGFKYLGR